MTGEGAGARESTAIGKDEVAPVGRASGILAAQDLRAMIAQGQISAEVPIGEAQVQPASLDLRLADHAYRVRASFLPGPGATVADRLEAFAMHRFDLGDGAVLEKGCVYIVPLQERLALKSRVAGIANPKSSTGRLDVFTRLITDHSAVFEHVAPGYRGPLYAEISPRTFSVVVRRGACLNQLRLRRGAPSTSDSVIRRLQDEVGLIDAGRGEADIADGIAVTVNLSGGARAGGGEGRAVGWRARHHAALIDLDRIGHYDPLEYWEPVRADGNGAVILNPGDFYILASKESVTVPPDHAAEMRPYDTRVGEFRVHYAGFFDPGFGHVSSDGSGSRAVLEIRSFEVPFVLRDGQLVGRLVYERLTQVPDKLYGVGIGSSYQRQRLALAKQFRRG
ncbi:MAG: 2'-deoxycytidine 5'-triphosphate deaminase [Rhodospirillales bacterium]